MLLNWLCPKVGNKSLRYEAIIRARDRKKTSSLCECSTRSRGSSRSALLFVCTLRLVCVAESAASNSLKQISEKQNYSLGHSKKTCWLYECVTMSCTIGVALRLPSALCVFCWIGCVQHFETNLWERTLFFGSDIARKVLHCTNVQRCKDAMRARCCSPSAFGATCVLLNLLRPKLENKRLKNETIIWFRYSKKKSSLFEC